MRCSPTRTPRNPPGTSSRPTDKRAARLNLISHLLDQIPRGDVPTQKIKLPRRQQRAYVRPPAESQTYVPTRYVA